MESTRISVVDVDLLALLGRNDQNLSLIETQYGVSLVLRGDDLTLNGDDAAVRRANTSLTHLVDRLRRDPDLSQEEIRDLIRQETHVVDSTRPDSLIKTYKTTIKFRSKGQSEYVNAMAKNDIVFAIGPAGTGKTYLAVAAAVAALRQKQVSRIVLARPAVEAGESLGFFPPGPPSKRR